MYNHCTGKTCDLRNFLPQWYQQSVKAIFVKTKSSNLLEGGPVYPFEELFLDDVNN
jgi:hypothetical protein